MNNKIDFDKLDNIFPGAYFDFASGCAEPGYNDNPVILADWNNVPDKVFDSLESKGFNCEWSDEWITCDECYKAFRCVPNSYMWQMAGVIFDGSALCLDCLDPEEYYESLENNPKNAVTWTIAERYNPEEYGYTLLQGDYENGLHEHMNDNPKQILSEALKNDPTGKYLFVMTDQSQFYITFAIYKKDNIE